MARHVPLVRALVIVDHPQAKLVGVGLTNQLHDLTLFVDMASFCQVGVPIPLRFRSDESGLPDGERGGA